MSDEKMDLATDPNFNTLLLFFFIEKNLRAEGQLFGVNNRHYSGHYFTGQRPEDIGIYGKIDDDHVPFLQRGIFFSSLVRFYK